MGINSGFKGLKKRYEGMEDAEEDISSYWLTFKKRVKVKVKCTFVQALRLCTGRTAHRGSRGIALL